MNKGNKRRAGLVLLGLAALAASVLWQGRSGPVSAIRPYLQAPGKTEITIMWTTPDRSAPTVRYGIGDALDRQAQDVTFQTIEFPGQEPGQASRTHLIYKAHLTGLAPGTSYRYSVRAGGQTTGGTFRTAPEMSAAGKFKFSFAAYGDSRSNPEVHSEIAAAIAKENPAFILHTGDMTGSGAYEEFPAEFFEPLAKVIDHIPLWPVLGNHEGDAAYLLLFALPNHGRWYSFDYGNVHLVGLDSEVGTKENAEMLAWLDKDLAAASADWKVAFYHRPSYDVSRYHSDWGRTDVLPLFRKHGVDLVFTGHSHLYQRFRPMFTAGQNREHPITYVVTAGGGAPLYSWKPTAYVAAGQVVHHHTVVTVDGPTLALRAIALDGTQIDALTISKKDGQLDAKYLAGALPEDGFDRAEPSETTDEPR